MNALELSDEILYRFADSGGNFVNEPIMGEVYETLRKQHDQLTERNLHLSLQKTEDGELVAVTYTNDDHQIVKVLWMKENQNV